MPATIAIPRPAADEYAQFYAGYVAQVPGEDALPVLADQLATLPPLVRGVSETQGLHRYAPGKWSVKEVIGHLCDSERVFAYRALRFARADRTPLPSFDENAWVPVAGSDGRPMAELAEELRAVREATLALFRSFDAAALERRGEASGKMISVRALAWIAAGHARHHATMLRERYGVAG